MEKETGKSGDSTRESHPALTLVIQSWMTPIIGLVMLLLGLAGGYFGRPLLQEKRTPENAAEPTPAATTSSPDIIQEEGDTNQDLRSLLLSQARHFEGDPDAPVVMFEFGDFQ